MAVLGIKLLGPIEVTAGKTRLDLTGERRLGVLARLALDVGKPVATDQLLAEVWARSTAATVSKQLHIVVSKLRATFVAHCDSGQALIETVPYGYRLNLDPDQVDAHLFTSRVRRARAVLAEGGVAEAARLFEDALALWRGPALSALSAPWAQTEAARLAEERLAATEDHFDLRLAMGEHASTIPGLTAHVEADPLRERPIAQLMLALYRADRPSDALRVYRDANRTFVDELGIEVGTELRRLQQAVLVRDAQLDLVSPVQETRIVPSAVPAELPPEAHELTARSSETAWLHQLLTCTTTSTPAVSVIDGPGGIGKSALAVHAARSVADHFTGGVIYVDLRGATAGVRPLTSIEALGHLLRSLGLVGASVPVDTDEAAARFRTLTSGQRLLIVLDNALNAHQVRPLMPAGADCRVVVTSRRALTTLDGAHHLHLAGLGSQDALALLSRVAGSARIQAEPEAAEEIVRLCAGLPLAIRIAAARLAERSDWTLTDLAGRLADATRRLDLLQHDDLAVRATIAVSHHQLGHEPSGHDAARLLEMLGLLDTPTYAVATTAALCDWTVQRTESAVDRLLGARLVESAGLDRYRMHDLTRLYTREVANREIAEAERVVAVRRALHHFLATAKNASILIENTSANVLADVTPTRPGIHFTSPQEAGSWIEQEGGNLVVAVQQAAGNTADPQTVIGLALALHWPFWQKGWLRELTVIHRIGLGAAIASGDDVAQAHEHNYLGWLYQDQGDLEESVGCLNEALRCWDRAGQPFRKASVWNNLGIGYTLMGRLDEALTCLQEALTIAGEAGRIDFQANIVNNQAQVLCKLGRLDDAIMVSKENLARYSTLDYAYGEGTAHDTLADAYRFSGRLGEAAESYLKAIALQHEAGHRLGEATSCWWLGCTYYDQGLHELARESWRRSVQILVDARLLPAAEAECILAQSVPDAPEPIRHQL